MSSSLSGIIPSFTFHIPTKIIFGVDSSSKISEEVERLGGKRLLLVTDLAIKKVGIVDKFQDTLKDRSEVEVYDKVEPEPRVQISEDICSFTRSGRFDLVIGVGGGSVLDTAKMASLMATNKGEVQDYISKTFNIDVFKNRGLPMILVPTTAGTGSDVSPNVMVIARESKVFISSIYFYPEVSIIDPRLTVTMPKKVTADTGLDALTHMIESMMSTASNPLTDALALEGVRLTGRYLKRAYERGDDLDARSGMCLAALLGGLSISSKMVYGHSIGYTIAIRYRLSHGASVALPLPYVMDYNLPACTAKLASIAQALGGEIEGLSEEEAAQLAVVLVKKLVEEVGVSSTLKEIGVPKEILPQLAEECVEKFPRPNNPVPLSKDDASKLYERMWSGTIGR